MSKTIYICAVWVFLAISGMASEFGLETQLSPKLKQFLVKHPTASQSLSNIVSQVVVGRALGISYFYTEDETRARCFHSYPDATSLYIVIRENQEPIDEYLCLIYEMLNSKSEKRFQELVQQAVTGSISRTDFAREVMRKEFDALKTTREVLTKIKFDEKEISNSHNYKHFFNCPDDFEGFLLYAQKNSNSKEGPLKDYEDQYDRIRKQHSHKDPKGSEKH